MLGMSKSVSSYECDVVRTIFRLESTGSLTIRKSVAEDFVES